MKLTDFKEVSEDVDLDEYLYLYKYVRDNMEHPEWLGTFTKEEIIARIKKQMPQEEYEALANYIVYNNNSIDELNKKADELLISIS